MTGFYCPTVLEARNLRSGVGRPLLPLEVPGKDQLQAWLPAASGSAAWGRIAPIVTWSFFPCYMSVFRFPSYDTSATGLKAAVL